MSSVGFALFCERVLSGVVVLHTGVEYHFVPFHRMFLIDKAKGRSGKVCRFGYSVQKLRFSIYSRFRYIRYRLKHFFNFWWIRSQTLEAKSGV